MPVPARAVPVWGCSQARAGPPLSPALVEPWSLGSGAGMRAKKTDTFFFFSLSPRFSGSKPLQKLPCSLLSSFLNSTHSLLFLLWDSICCDALSAPSIATKPPSFDSCPQLRDPARSSMVQGPCCASPCTLVRSLHHDPSSPTSDGFWGRGEQSCPSRHGLLVPAGSQQPPEGVGTPWPGAPGHPLGIGRIP